MEAMNAMNNYYGYGYGQPVQQQAYYDPNQPYFGYQASVYQNVQVPQNVNALSDEEIKILKTARPTSKLELNIEHNDVLRAICGHKENHHDVVQIVNDGTGDVYCPICQARWNPDAMTKEEVTNLVETLIGQMQNAKWVGDLPIELSRELFTLIPLLRKYPEIHEYAMNTFNKYYSQRGMYNAQEANVYAQYNGLFAPTGYGYAPQAPQGYYGQQAMPQSTYYYGQQPQMNQGQPMQANPNYNPMQAPYGVMPGATNQQFVQQADMMMGGSVYGQPQQTAYYGQQPQMMNAPQAPGYNPTFAAPQAQQPQQAAPTAEADKTVKSETKIDL